MPAAAVSDGHIDMYAPMMCDSSDGQPAAAAPAAAPPPVTLSVFWCGTAGFLGRDPRPCRPGPESIRGSFTTQVGLFFLLCDAVDLSDEGDRDGGGGQQRGPRRVPAPRWGCLPVHSRGVCD